MGCRVLGCGCGIAIRARFRVERACGWQEAERRRQRWRRKRRGKRRRFVDKTEMKRQDQLPVGLRAPRKRRWRILCLARCSSFDRGRPLQ